VAERRSGSWFAVLLLLAGVRADAAFCTSGNGFDLGDHPPQPSLGIRLFDLNLHPDFPMRAMEHVRTTLAESLRARLAESRYFGPVTLLPADSEQSADFTMIGAFTQAAVGSNQFNLYDILTQHVFDRPSTVSIVGGIVRGKDADPATTFQCQLSCCKVWSVGGIPGPMHTGTGKIDLEIGRIAREMKTVYVQKPKIRKAQGK
jgi:hypothetical protein